MPENPENRPFDVSSTPAPPWNAPSSPLEEPPMAKGTPSMTDAPLMGPPMGEAPRHMPEPLNKTDLAAIGLAIVGALNWGLVGLFNRNLVSGLFGKNTFLSRTVYATVGAAGAYAIYSAAKARRAGQAI